MQRCRGPSQATTPFKMPVEFTIGEFTTEELEELLDFAEEGSAIALEIRAELLRRLRLAESQQQSAAYPS